VFLRQEKGKKRANTKRGTGCGGKSPVGEKYPAVSKKRRDERCGQQARKKNQGTTGGGGASPRKSVLVIVWEEPHGM